MRSQICEVEVVWIYEVEVEALICVVKARVTLHVREVKACAKPSARALRKFH